MLFIEAATAAVVVVALPRSLSNNTRQISFIVRGRLVEEEGGEEPNEDEDQSPFQDWGSLLGGERQRHFHESRLTTNIQRWSGETERHIYQTQLQRRKEEILCYFEFILIRWKKRNCMLVIFRFLRRRKRGEKVAFITDINLTDEDIHKFRKMCFKRAFHSCSLLASVENISHYTYDRGRRSQFLTGPLPIFNVDQ